MDYNSLHVTYFLAPNRKCLCLQCCCHRNSKTDVWSNRWMQAGYFNLVQ